MVSFREFVKNKALQDQLPFDIDFDLEPLSSNVPTELIAGLLIPKYNELLTQEAWFFESLETLNTNSRTVGQRMLRKLCKSLKVACELETLEAAVTQLFNPSPDIANSQAYLNWEDANEDLIDEMISGLKATQTALAMEWVRVTFFLASRYDSNWTHNDTARLPESQREEIARFITKEANGGVMPESEPVATGSVATEPEGKEPPALPEKTGETSTGN